MMGRVGLVLGAAGMLAPLEWWQCALALGVAGLWAKVK